MHILAYPCVARRAFVVLGCRMLPRCRPEGSFGSGRRFSTNIYPSSREVGVAVAINFLYEHLSLYEEN